MNKNQNTRAYSIKEVSKKLNVPTGTLRQWEKDLEGLLVIPRTKQGARFYTEPEMDLLFKIKEMRGKNVGKEMIRTLLENYLNPSKEEPSETFEMVIQDPPIDKQVVSQNNIEEFYQAMANYKMELVNEIKQEIIQTRRVLIDEIKNELSHTSLQTVNEVSKSIQRSNDKRKAEMQQLSDQVVHVSKQTSESFGSLSETINQSSQLTSESLGTLTEKLTKSSEQASETLETINSHIAKSSEHTSESIKSLKENVVRMTEKTHIQMQKQVAESSKSTITNMDEITKAVQQSKSEFKRYTQSLNEKQEQILETIQELRQTKEEIQLREETFQKMLVGYREVAAAKKRKWWQLWE
ncbi:MerR family transcriptional regulator [Bacillus sp. 31A1R]|uniref:MerR family transcriptional regulator n=1 Tax=Robertmurraya mangrovi TaxID=3098077 RepID=A0ABU5IWI8_9BACI|nr:MerR family transcriptional regulator [Bacillus sp. 31A1R]MDZ5471515.1 MerR family transcriptional regulator [Bacillus sp. 31A1R]